MMATECLLCERNDQTEGYTVVLWNKHGAVDFICWNCWREYHGPIKNLFHQVVKGETFAKTVHAFTEKNSAILKQMNIVKSLVPKAS